MFYDKFISLCVQKGETPAQVSKNIGLSNAAATGWKNGKKPNAITIKRLADYFDISVDELKDPESTFYRKYIRLCNSIKKTPSAVALEIGITKATVSRWKSGSSPTDANAQKVADYFGVPVSELLEEKEKPAPTNEGELAADMEKKLLAVFRQVPVNRQSEVLALIEDALKILLLRQEQSE